MDSRPFGVRLCNSTLFVRVLHCCCWLFFFSFALAAREHIFFSLLEDFARSSTVLPLAPSSSCMCLIVHIYCIVCTDDACISVFGRWYFVSIQYFVFFCCLCFALLCECTILNVTLDLCLVLLLTQFRFAAPRRMQLVQSNTIRMDFPPESRWLPSYSYRIALNTNAFISCNNQFLLLLTNNMAIRSLVHMQARGHSLKIHSNPILTWLNM